MAEKNAQSPAPSKPRRVDISLSQNSQGNAVEDDQNGFMSKSQIDSHLVSLKHLQKEGKIVPKSCNHCIKEALRQLQISESERGNDVIASSLSSSSVTSNESNISSSNDSIESFFENLRKKRLQRSESYDPEKYEDDYNSQSRTPDMNPSEFGKCKCFSIKSNKETGGIVIKKIECEKLCKDGSLVIKTKSKERSGNEKVNRSENFENISMNLLNSEQQNQFSQLNKNNFSLDSGSPDEAGRIADENYSKLPNFDAGGQNMIPHSSSIKCKVCHACHSISENKNKSDHSFKREKRNKFVNIETGKETKTEEEFVFTPRSNEFQDSANSYDEAIQRDDGNVSKYDQRNVEAMSSYSINTDTQRNDSNSSLYESLRKMIENLHKECCAMVFNSIIKHDNDRTTEDFREKMDNNKNEYGNLSDYDQRNYKTMNSYPNSSDIQRSDGPSNEYTSQRKTTGNLRSKACCAVVRDSTTKYDYDRTAEDFPEKKGDNRNEYGNMNEYDQHNIKTTRSYVISSDIQRSEGTDNPYGNSQKKIGTLRKECCAVVNDPIKYQDYDCTTEDLPEKKDDNGLQDTLFYPAVYSSKSTREDVNKMKENEGGSSSITEYCDERHAKREEIMKKRELVWGDNIPPEMIIKNTRYAKRHADCCVGNIVSEYNLNYVCPKYGDYSISAAENEYINRMNIYSNNKFVGEKELNNDENIRNSLIDDKSESNCVDGTFVGQMTSQDCYCNGYVQSPESTESKDYEKPTPEYDIPGYSEGINNGINARNTDPCANIQIEQDETNCGQPSQIKRCKICNSSIH